MAFYRSGGGGGSAYLSHKELAEATIASTSATNITLSDDIDDFDYLLITMQRFDGAKTTQILNYQGMLFINPTVLKAASQTIHWTGGTNAASNYNTEISYVNDTTLSFKPSNAGSRTYYVYGIKWIAIGTSRTETILWTNPNPTANFSRQTIALSDNMDNYQYLKFDFRSSSSNDERASILVPIDTVKKCTIPSSGAGQYVNVGLVSLGSGTRYCRMIAYISNSSIEFSAAYQMNGSGTPTTMSIPLQIIGLKY